MELASNLLIPKMDNLSHNLAQLSYKIHRVAEGHFVMRK